MTWDGIERRKELHECNQIGNITTLVSDQRHAMEVLDKHTSQGHIWRVVIAGSVITIILQVILFSNMFGRLAEKVDHISVSVRDNSIMIRKISDMSERLGVLEEKVSWIEEDIIVRRQNAKTYS